MKYDMGCTTLARIGYAEEECMSSLPSTDRTRSVLALVAHDEKKDALTDFCVRHRQALEAWDLIGTGSTAQRISEATELPVQGYLSGPKGGMHRSPPASRCARLVLSSFCLTP
jgi:hypothetical protein